MFKKLKLEHEDSAALLVGGFLLIGSLVSFTLLVSPSIRGDVKAIRQQLDSLSSSGVRGISWHKAYQQLQSTEGTKTSWGAKLKWLSGKPGGWSKDPFRAFSLSEKRANIQAATWQTAWLEASKVLDSLEENAVDAEKQASEAGFQDQALNMKMLVAADEWRSHLEGTRGLKQKAQGKPYNKWSALLLLALFFIMIYGAVQFLRGERFWSFAKGFVGIYFLAIFAYLLAGQQSVQSLGIGYAAWAIVIGLLISNTIGTPGFIKPALTTELYIKSALILLGAEILFGKILAIGLPGIFVAWVVTPIVLVTTYWFGQRILKISSKTLNITISADMSVCGVSAAVATAAASRATKEELTLAIGLSMVFTSVMMIVLPIVIHSLGLPEVLGGAWIGGTIDATGAVVAAGAFLGEDALNVAATIKMIQNILIGIIAFGVAIYFSKMEGQEQNVEIGWGEIWRRFPKFILGFIGASILFSIVYEALGNDMAYAVLDRGLLGGFTKNIRGWLFCIAFVSIGLSTNFRELKAHFSGGKPLILYLVGQAFNLTLTLLMAYIMFYLVFPEITANI